MYTRMIRVHTGTRRVLLHLYAHSNASGPHPRMPVSAESPPAGFGGGRSLPPGLRAAGQVPVRVAWPWGH